MRYWRNARKILLSFLNKPFYYQHRLTKYLFVYKKSVHNHFLPLFEMRLFNILMRSRLILDQTFALICIHSNLVFVNGFCCKNSNFQIFQNDFLQLIVSFKYYITFRWLLNNTQKIKKKLGFLSW